ncbi:hypothetical protein NRK67_10680 [Fusobacteria bacterium ZRK30]|nr:hypothetical protein NRK67_10680 [Fusobacteria bacterium ZRK30]
MKKILYIILIVISFTGCSVLIAGSKPTKPIDEEKVIKLETREQVEKKLTRSIVKEEKTENGTLVTYEKWYDRGAKVRMVLHAGLDVVTVGLWELIGTVGEINTNPTAFYDLDILYGKNNEIKDVVVREK